MYIILTNKSGARWHVYVLVKLFGIIIDKGLFSIVGSVFNSRVSYLLGSIVLYNTVNSGRKQNMLERRRRRRTSLILTSMFYHHQSLKLPPGPHLKLPISDPQVRS